MIENEYDQDMQEMLRQKLNPTVRDAIIRSLASNAPEDTARAAQEEMRSQTGGDTQSAEQNTPASLSRKKAHGWV